MKNAEIKDRIKIAMEIRDIKQSELVEKTGIDKGQLSSYIRGRYKPKQVNIQLIANALSVDEAWLMGYDVPMEGEPSLEQIITTQIKKQGISLEDVAKKANVSYEWLKNIDSFSPSLEPQSNEFDLSLGKPLDCDDELYTQNSYGCISRVAKVIGLPPSMLRAALARQEIPSPEEYNHVSAQEAFGFTNIISSTQSADEKNSLQPTTKEQNIIKQYRALDSHGKDIVDTILTKEADRMKELENIQPSTVIDIQTRLGDNTRLIEYHRSASAGTGVFILGNEGVDQLSIPDTPENRKVDYAIRVSGNSMEPDYYDGDIVLVSQKVELKHGDVGIFIINNDAYIKEYEETELISRNQDSPNITISEYDNIVCMGKVVGKYEE